MIIPQIYFGFDNETLPFESCASQWAELCKSRKVLLCAGLAVYKAGKEDTFAGDSGKNEWKENSDILKRQVEYLRENGFDGFCLYSSQFVNFNEKDKNKLNDKKIEFKVYNTINQRIITLRFYPYISPIASSPTVQHAAKHRNLLFARQSCWQACLREP